jgi:Sec-independent protein secretion pathway component TatC
MSDTSEKKSTTELFVAHLIELRTRLLHSVVALLLVFIALFPWRQISTPGWRSPCCPSCPKAHR